MKPGVRMMMISSLGEDGGENRRNIGFQSERRGEKRPEENWEGEYERPESEYGTYGARRPYSGDDYGRRDTPRSYGRPEGSMSPWRREEAARRLGEDRYRERMEKEEHEGGRKHRQMDRRRNEEDEDDLSGSFRHRETSGHVSEKGTEELTEEKVKKWVNGMQGSDGKTGAHYQMDQAELLRANYCPQCDKLEFYGCINMIYSDYSEVAKRYSVDRPEFYAHMAKAFLMDKDAEEGKLAKYMRYVAGK